MSKNKKFLLQGVLFCIIFVITFFPVQQIFVRKSLAKPWDMSYKIAGFYNEPENEFSAMYFGSSHAYASFSPMQIWENTGVKSYVFATQMQPIWASYTYLKEALKTQSPELVILECNMLTSDEEYMDEGTNYSYMDDIPLSQNKIELATISEEEGSRLPLVLNFIKYHSRWSSLTGEDFTYNKNEAIDPYKGYVMLPQKQTESVIDRGEMDTSVAPQPITEKNEQYLRMFIELCLENNINLWLVKAPSNLTTEELAKLKTVESITSEYGVSFDNFNTEEAYNAMGLRSNEHFFDQRHMDLVGASLFCDYFSSLMLEKYPQLETDKNNEKWASELVQFEDDFAYTLENPVEGQTTTAAEDK